jgi:hypothetical protein
MTYRNTLVVVNCEIFLNTYSFLGIYMIKIEFACIHNNGRSPLAEGFAKQRLEQLNETGFDVFSSGTQAKIIEDYLYKDNFLPEQFIRKVATNYLERKRLDEHSELRVELLLESDSFNTSDLKYLNGLFRDYAKEDVFYENYFREKALKKFNLNPCYTNKQSKVIPNLNFFLGMGKDNVQWAKNTYSDEKNKPVIETLAGYATKTSGAEFQSAFGKGLKDYLEMAEVIRSYSHQCIDKVLGKL